MRAQPYISIKPRNSSGTAKELSEIPFNEIPTLGCVAHCSWCSQLVVAGITRCSVTHTALWDNMCGHRCFPIKPEVLNANWNQLLTYVVPEKCSELKKPKEFWSSLPQYSNFFLFSSFTIEVHCAWTGKTYRHFIYERWWPLRDEKRTRVVSPIPV